jgi:signal peptidase I
MKLSRLLRLDRVIKNDSLREWVEALIFALIVAGIFRTWLYSPYNVPTGSMIPTIEIGDYLFGDMHAYGFVVPLTGVKLFRKEVKRGDIIIFPSPIDPKTDYIKRAVAVGGDEVALIGENIYINGRPEEGAYQRYDENLPPVVWGPEFAVPRRFTVPPGKVWPLGDNRRNSLDGRYWGFIDEKDVRARGLIIGWSRDPSQNLLSGYRFERIGRWLE